MRISTSTLYATGLSRLSELQSGMLKAQQQISTGRRILTPADDPVAAARALDLTQGQSVNAQYGSNRMNAKSALSQEEGALQSLTNLIQDIREQSIIAGNGALDDTQRGFIATELRGRFEHLLGIGNSRDGTGNFLFAGYQSTAEPFAISGGNAQYVGDQGKKLLQVGAARQMAVGDSGDAVFMNIPGSGTLTSAADFANTGNAGISRAVVFNAAALPTPARSSYDITFDVTAGVTSYSIDTVPPVTGVYTSGAPIQFEGLELMVTDGAAPIATGDRFTVRPSRTQSLFTTVNDLINLLETPAVGTTPRANLTYGLGVATKNLDSALDSVLAIRTSVGSRLKEIDSLDDAGEDRNIQYALAISNLQDVDPYKAISDLTQHQITLEAAQKSFMQISRLSLFDML